MNIITLYKITPFVLFYSNLFFFVAFLAIWHIFICLLISPHHSGSFMRARTLFCLLLYLHHLEQWLACSRLTRNICYMDDEWSHKPRSDLWNSLWITWNKIRCLHLTTWQSAWVFSRCLLNEWFNVIFLFHLNCSSLKERFS